MTALEKLRAGRARIERGWTQGAYARDVHDFAVDIDSPDAEAWCVIGALGLSRVKPECGSKALFFLQRAIPASAHQPEEPEEEAFDTVLKWNDNRCHSQEEALAVFDAAIAIAEAEDG